MDAHLGSEGSFYKLTRMKFKSLYFNLNRSDYPNEYGYRLLLKSRHFCAYVEREILKKAKAETVGFNRWVIEFHDNPNKYPRINTEKVLVSHLKFDQAEFDRALKTNTSKYFVHKLETALDHIRKYNYGLPIVEIEKGIIGFVNGGYRNEWIYKKKKSEDRKTEVRLKCILDENKFTLDIEIYKGKELAFGKNLLKLDPDPVAYYHRFNDIIFQHDNVLITDKFGDSFFVFDIKNI